MIKLQRIREMLVEYNLEAILLSNAINRNYMSGFTGSDGMVLISKENAFFLTDFRYVEQANEQCQGYEIISRQSKSYALLVTEICQKAGISKLGFEADTLTYNQYLQYKNPFGDEHKEQAFKLELVPVANIVETIRSQKNDSELKKMQIAAEIADATFAKILTFIRPGITEIAVANEMERIMREAGAKCSSFDIIVASGKRSSFPHGVASTKMIETGDMITIDFGANYNGYMSDMTRTIALGDPGEQLKEIYAIVLKAQTAVCEQLKAGMLCSEADAIARNIISEAGYGKYFGHSLGHGLGMEVHEKPYLAATATEKLKANMVVTNEPGIYLPGVGGVRIEDELVITETGNYTLTISTKDLIIL